MKKTNNDLGERIKESVKEAKKVIEKPVEIVGLDLEQQHYINQIFQVVESATLEKLQTDLTILEENKKRILEPLVLYKMALKLVKETHSKTKVYKDLERGVKGLEQKLEPIEQNIERYKDFIDFTQSNIDKMKSHIDIETLEDKVVWTYDTDYFLPILDLAILTIPLNKYEEKDKEEEEKGEQ